MNFIAFLLCVLPFCSVDALERTSINLDFSSFRLDSPIEEAKEMLLENPYFQAVKEGILSLLHNPENAFVEVAGLEALETIAEKKLAFMAISSLLGSLMLQNPLEKNFITDIFDRGTAAASSFAHHSGAVPFHSDGAFLSKPPTVIGIWVESPAVSGGETELVNSCAFVHQLSQFPEGKKCVSLLQQPLPIHIHNSYHVPDTPAYLMKTPIKDGCVVFREDLLMEGIKEALPLQDQANLILAVKFFAENLSNADERIKFLMEKDRIYFFNNNNYLHNRRAFRGNRRIWRVWIESQIQQS